MPLPFRLIVLFLAGAVIGGQINRGIYGLAAITKRRISPWSGIALHIAPPELCTDNAVMGAIALERLAAGLVEDLDLEIVPGMVRP